MNTHKHRELIIDKSTEPRTPEISQMIDEGGLGADKYYEIMKEITSSKEHSDKANESFIYSYLIPDEWNKIFLFRWQRNRTLMMSYDCQTK